MTGEPLLVMAFVKPIDVVMLSPSRGASGEHPGTEWLNRSNDLMSNLCLLYCNNAEHYVTETKAKFTMYLVHGSNAFALARCVSGAVQIVELTGS
jgi:hypothetical protein